MFIKDLSFGEILFTPSVDENTLQNTRISSCFDPKYLIWKFAITYTVDCKYYSIFLKLVKRFHRIQPDSLNMSLNMITKSRTKRSENKKGFD